MKLYLAAYFKKLRDCNVNLKINLINSTRHYTLFKLKT